MSAVRRWRKPAVVQVVELTALYDEPLSDFVTFIIVDPAGKRTTIKAAYEDSCWVADVRELAILLPLDEWAFLTYPEVQPAMLMFTYDTGETVGAFAQGPDRELIHITHLRTF